MIKLNINIKEISFRVTIVTFIAAILWSLCGYADKMADE